MDVSLLDVESLAPAWPACSEQQELIKSSGFIRAPPWLPQVPDRSLWFGNGIFLGNTQPALPGTAPCALTRAGTGGDTEGPSWVTALPGACACATRCPAWLLALGWGLWGQQGSPGWFGWRMLGAGGKHSNAARGDGAASLALPWGAERPQNARGRLKCGDLAAGWSCPPMAQGVR